MLDGALVALMLTQGHEAHSRVIQGVPDGAYLCGATLHRGRLYLEFEHTDWDERSDQFSVVFEQIPQQRLDHRPGPQEVT